MTDYTQSTGSTGTMMIRDTGSWVEFWLNAGNPTSYNYQLPWGYNVNGQSSSSEQYRYSPNSGWQKLGSWNVTYSQTVEFDLGRTGTGGMGGPTTLTAYISRSTIPDPPTITGPWNVTSNSVTINMYNNADNGATIYDHQIGYGTDPWNVQYLSALSGQSGYFAINGLAPGATYYFWGRAWNQNGWSGWGNRISCTMLRTPDAPSQPLLASVTVSTVDVSFSPNGDGGASILAYQVGYGTDSSGPSTNVNATSPVTITGLSPGTVYYFWVRAQNSVGWGPWSVANSVRTVAGAYVGVTPVVLPIGMPYVPAYKLAVVYVNVGGTWKLAEPWVKVMGVWTRTT